MHLIIDASRANDVHHKTGVHNHARGMIEALMNVLPNHVRVTMITKLPLDNGWPALPAHWTHRRLAWPLPLWTTIRCSLFLMRHISSDTYLFCPASQPPLIHPRLIATIHDVGFKRHPALYPTLARRWLDITTHYTLARARIVIVPSQFTKHEIMACYGADETKIVVVPNAHRVGHVDKTSDKKSGLLYVGRIEHKKNIICIVRAFEILKRAYGYPHLTLTLVGPDGHGAARIRQRIARSAFVSGIIITGYVDDQTKNRMMRQAEIILFPSWYEGFGIPILEASVAGTRMVASNIPPHSEVGGVYISYADPRSPRAWAEVIHSILSIHTTPPNEKNAPHERFSWERSAHIWWEKVSKLANTLQSGVE